MIAFAALAQDSGLTAREMFLAARDKVAAKPAAPARKSAPALPSAEAASVKPPRQQVPKRQNAPVSSSNPDLIQAAYSTTPLGLRYTIVKRDGGNSTDVPTDTVFHNGDKIQVAVEVTEPGFLYIVARGSSGTWQLLFPSPKIENGDNRVEAKGKIQVPGNYNFVFSGKPGTEKLFIVFSRKTEPEIDSLIYSLQDKKPKPDSEPQLMASIAPINDSVVSVLRTSYSRDLIIEPVNESANSKPSGQHPEHAVYVVNPKGGEDSRVVADISLTHQ